MSFKSISRYVISLKEISNNPMSPTYPLFSLNLYQLKAFAEVAFEVTNCDHKLLSSSLLNSNIKPAGNLSIFLLTACFNTLVFEVAIRCDYGKG